MAGAALMGLLAAFYLYWGWSSILADFGGDNAVYWLTANFFSPYGEPLSPAAHFAATSIYPPLYPAVLALFGGGESLLNAHLVTAAIIVLAFVAIYRLALNLGLDAAAAIATVMLFAGLPITLIEGLDIHSEHLYLLLSSTALALAVREGRDATALYTAAACVAGAYLTRSFGVTLGLSFLLWLALHQRRHWPQCAAIVATPLVLWSLLHGGSGRYLDNMLEIYGRAGFVTQLGANAGMLWPSWVACFSEPGLGGFLPALPGALAPVCLTGTLLRVRAAALDGLYALAYLGLIVLWPYPAEYQRLFYPLMPLLLIHAVYAVSTLGRRRASLERVALLLLLAIILGAELPFLLLVGTRLASPPADAGFLPYTRSRAWYYADPRTAFATLGYQRGVTEALRDIKHRGLIPATDCMLAIKPAVAALYSERLVHGFPLPGGNAVALEQSLRRGPCSYLFMVTDRSPSYPDAYFPYRHLEASLELVAVYPNRMLERLPAALLGRLKPPAAAAPD